ncbi:MAG: hypothetical protein H2056_07630 [Sphingopyxis sp.]|nr:hypothetical protein [Sphingopyxis sp.]
MALVFLLVLGGCDAAISDRPMFTQTDTVGAPKFKDGVWAPVDQDDCQVDKEKRVSQWPDCAEWAYFKDGHLFERRDKNGIELKPVSQSYLIVGGTPAMVQIEHSPVESEDGVTFSFWALDHGAVGQSELRVVELWQVLCGRRDDVPDGKESEAADEATPMFGDLIRFPGFNEKCRPDSVASLRTAALASRTLPPENPIRLEWVRAKLD